MTCGGCMHGSKHVTGQLEKVTCRLHCLWAFLRLLLLTLGRAKEAAKEARLLFLEVDFKIFVIIQLCGGHLSLFRLRRCRLVGVQAVRDESHSLEKKLKKRTERRQEAHLMSVQEVGVRRVDVARLHRYHIGNELRCGRHGRLEEIHNYAVETLTQRRIPTERLLKSSQKSEDGECKRSKQNARSLKVAGRECGSVRRRQADSI
jgi:hypothetical protein